MPVNLTKEDTLIADCGQVASSSVSLIADGYPEKRGGAPWNVAIYSTEFNSETPRFICGGTLINAELVLSGKLILSIMKICFQTFMKLPSRYQSS